MPNDPMTGRKRYCPLLVIAHETARQRQATRILNLLNSIRRVSPNSAAFRIVLRALGALCVSARAFSPNSFLPAFERREDFSRWPEGKPAPLAGSANELSYQKATGRLGFVDIGMGDLLGATGTYQTCAFR